MNTTITLYFYGINELSLFVAAASLNVKIQYFTTYCFGSLKIEFQKTDRKQMGAIIKKAYKSSKFKQTLNP